MTLINRFSTIKRGAITITGNTLGLCKTTGTLLPGTNGSIGAFTTTNVTLSVPTGWEAIVNLANKENITLDWRNNSSSAYLNIPVGSTVLYAELIWAGTRISSTVDVTSYINDAIQFVTPSGTFYITPYVGSSSNISNFYTRSADVTSLVLAAGSGTYTAGAVPCALSPTNEISNSAGWSLIVVYENALLPTRSMKVYSGGNLVNSTNSTNLSITGFLTDIIGPYDARISISTLNGHATITGDEVYFGPTLASLSLLYGPNNPANPPDAISNFFGSQINNGDPASINVGLIDTTGTFGNNNNNPFTLSNVFAGRQSWDVTNIDASSTVTSSQSTAILSFISSSDEYIPNGIGVQIDAIGPVINITKAVDKTETIKGDTLHYTLTITNTGNVATNNFNLIDNIPTGTTLDLASIVVAGETGPLVDNSTTTQLNLELGSVFGAPQVVTVDFDVTTTAITPDIVQNQATSIFDYSLPAIQTTENSNTVSTNVIAYPLQVEKTAIPSIVGLGDEITFTITISNNSPLAVDLTNLILFDIIPEGTSYVTDSFTVNGVSQLVTATDFITGISIGSLLTGSTKLVIFKVRLVSLPCPSIIVNSATVSFQYQITLGNTITATTQSNDAIVDIKNSGFKQSSVYGTVSIPYGNPNIQTIIDVIANLIIDSTKIVITPAGVSQEGQTLSGKKLNICGRLCIDISYISDNQSVNSFQCEIPVCEFIVIPIDINTNCTIQPYTTIEDIYYQIIDIMNIFYNITFLIETGI